MIDVHLLRFALAAAETGSFSRAADRFRVKQSTLSKQVRHLELRLGLPLFNRSTQGVSPTAGGVRFLARARTIVNDLDQLSQESRALAYGRQGCLRLGFQGQIAGGLRTVLSRYREAFPQVEVEAIEGGREALLNGLDRDRLDLAVLAGECSDCGRCSLYLWSEPLAIAMRPDHGLLSREQLYWTDLKHFTFLVTQSEPGDLIAAIIASRMTGPSHVPHVVTQAVSPGNLVQLVSDDSVAVMLGEMPSGDGIEYREVHDAFGPTRLDHSLHWLASNGNPAARTFLSAVATHFGCRVNTATASRSTVTVGGS